MQHVEGEPSRDGRERAYLYIIGRATSVLYGSTMGSTVPYVSYPTWCVASDTVVCTLSERDKVRDGAVRRGGCERRTEVVLLLVDLERVFKAVYAQRAPRATTHRHT